MKYVRKKTLRRDKGCALEVIVLNNNFFVAWILLNSVINSAIGISGISYVTNGILIILLAICCYLRRFFVPKEAVLSLLFIVLTYIISYIRLMNVDYTSYLLIRFCVFGAIPLLCGACRFDEVEVFQLISIIGLPFSVICVARGYLSSYTVGISDKMAGKMMGMSYAMLPLLLSSISLIVIKKSRIIAVLDVVLVVGFYLLFANRGIWISVFIYLLMIIFAYIRRKRNGHIKLLLLLVSSAIAMTFVFANFLKIVEFLYYFIANSFGIKIYALRKLLMYNNKGDILNGRMAVWNEAIDISKSNILFGRGIGYIEGIWSGGHAHNIFLQTLCEAGLLVAFPLFVIFVWAICDLLISKRLLNMSKSLFCAFAVSCGIIPLLYSLSHWQWMPFWLFLGYALTNICKIER